MLAIIIMLTVIPLIILVVGFFEIPLPFIKQPAEIIMEHHQLAKGQIKKINKYLRRKSLINHSHVGFIKLSS